MIIKYLRDSYLAEATPFAKPQCSYAAACAAESLHRFRRAGRNLAVGSDVYPLRMHRRGVGLEVTELLLLL